MAQKLDGERLAKELAVRMKMARLDKGLTQDQAAEEAWVYRQHWLDLEHARRPHMSFAVVMRVALALNLSLDDIKHAMELPRDETPASTPR